MECPETTIFSFWLRWGSLELFGCSWPQAAVLPISASQVSRITGVSHGSPVYLFIFIFKSMFNWFWHKTIGLWKNYLFYFESSPLDPRGQQHPQLSPAAPPGPGSHLEQRTPLCAGQNGKGWETKPATAPLPQETGKARGSHHRCLSPGLCVSE
jgi:hypothetical protein